MASIIENLITELNDEYALYEQLLQVSMEKTGAIVSNNLDRLSETTEKEQRLADALASVEHRRRETMTNVANILGKRPDDVKVMDVVTFLEGQPEFSLEPRQETDGGTFAPIVPEEPFSYIERLKTGFLVRKYGEIGVLFPDTQSDSSNPTGQWSEPKMSE